MYKRVTFLLVSSLVMSIWFVIVAPNLYAMDDLPETVELFGLVNIYEPVEFDHALHMDVASCAVCHHHTTGESVEDERCMHCHKDSGETDMVACADCHPDTRYVLENFVVLEFANNTYHQDRTGLKRAYHLTCMGCHQENDVPSGCDDCHQEK